MAIVSNFELTGTLAALLFIIANIYYPAKFITKRMVPLSGEIRDFFKDYLKAHITLNLIGLWFVILHGHFADEKNFFLQAAMVVTIWLCTAGALMHFKYPEGSIVKLRLLHSQHFMFVLWVALIFIGHVAL